MFSKLISMINEYRIYNRTIRELSSMDDRQLSDIGIHRSNIMEVARQSAT